MESERSFWNEIAEPYLARDWSECIARIGVILDAQPFAMTPRQVMARLLLVAGNRPHALLQYEKLLPLAVRAGDLYRGLLIQKHMDAIEPGAPGRYATLQKWFRLVGVKDPAPTTDVQGCVSARALLTLPKDVFEWMGGEVRVDVFDPEPREMDVASSTLWVVLFGSLLWKARLPNGRERGEVRSERGEFAYMPGTPGTIGTMRFRGETACECLRFEGPLLRELGLRAPSLGGALEAPALPALPHGLRRSKTPAGAGQPSTPGPPLNAPRLGAPGPAPDALEGESSDSPGSGQLSSGDPPDLASWGVQIIDLGEDPDAAAARRRKERAARRAAGHKQPSGQERRTRDRTQVDAPGRIGLLGLGGPGQAPLRCRLFDLSPFGAGVEFEDRSKRHRVASLAQSAVVLELAPPIGAKPLRLAGRVRWIDRGAPAGLARLGIEFVLVTEDHLAAIGGLMTALT